MQRSAFAVPLLLWTAAAPAQQALPPAKAKPSTLPDIVVTDRLDAPENPETVTVAPPRLPGRDQDKTATYVDAARRAARCAAKGRLTRLSLLREVVDGRFPSPGQSRAQRWLVRQTAACGEGRAIALLDIDPTDYDTGINSPQKLLGFIRRGEFVVEALKAYAPGDPPTADALADPVVQQRFVTRESEAAKGRQPQDLEYFRVAICMVREQPGLAARLVRTDPVTTSTHAIQGHLIERTRGCTGYVRRVVVDRYEFRYYIADALYRWTVAARGVDTLIPATVEEADRLRAASTAG